MRHTSGNLFTELQAQHRCERSRASGASLSIREGRGWDLKEKAREFTQKAAPAGETEGVAWLCSFPGV